MPCVAILHQDSRTTDHDVVDCAGPRANIGGRRGRTSTAASISRGSLVWVDSQ